MKEAPPEHGQAAVCLLGLDGPDAVLGLLRRQALGDRVEAGKNEEDKGGDDRDRRLGILQHQAPMDEYVLSMWGFAMTSGKQYAHIITK